MNQAPIELVERFIGIPFKWGGRSKEEGLDCIGIVLEFLQAAGFRKYDDDRKPYADGWWKSDPQRFIREVLSRGCFVEKISDLKLYDVICFQVGGVTRHIGVYLGYDKFLHSYIQASGIDRLDRWKPKFAGAIRPSRENGL